MIKTVLLMILSVVCGALMGIASKAADVAVQGSFSGDFFFAFGSVTTGFLIWCTIGYFIALFTKELRCAVAYNMGFFLSMLAGYYIYSTYVVKYLNMRVVLFWTFMTAAVFAATIMIKRFRNNRIFHMVTICGIIIIAAVDIIIIQGGNLPALAMECILLIMIFLMVRYNHREIKRS